jgi:EpsI family protein
MPAKLPKAFWVVMITLGALAFFRLAMPDSFRIDETKNPFFETFPFTLQGWKGEESPVDRRTYEILETRNVLSRSYRNSAGEKVHLLLVSSKKDRRVAHPPEVCFTGANFVITDEKDRALDWRGQKIPAREFVAKNERDAREVQTVLYFYKVGKTYTANYYKQQISFAMDRAANRASDVLLVRLSGGSDKSFREFFDALMTVLDTAA